VTRGRLVGTRTLVRLALRRDRLVLPIWVAVMGALPASTLSTYERLYPTAADRAGLTATMGGARTLVAMYGPPYDLTSAGGFTAWRMSGFLALFTGLLASFTVIRHSRAEEEIGRAELLASGVVGRYAFIASATLTAVAASAAVGLVVAVLLVGSGASLAGSVAMGAGCAAVGVVFAGVAAVTSQLATFARTANAMAFSVLAVAFVLRAVGDANTSIGWLAWLSPLSWATHLRAFSDERWWPLALAAAVTTALLVLARTLLDRRDLGSGVLAASDGPDRAPARLSTSLALTWRLQRGTLLLWCAGVAVFGAALGSLTGSIADVMGGKQDIEDMVRDMGGSYQITDAYVALTLSMFGLIAAVYAVQAMLLARAEEERGRTETLLASGATRLRWLGSHLAQSLVGSAALVILGGLAVGATAWLTADVPVSTVLQGAVVQLPAVWVFSGLTCLLVGLLPRGAVVAWFAVGACLGLWFVGSLLGLSDAVLSVSPFEHVPKVPGNALAVAPLVTLGAIAVLLTLAGLAGIRRRDVG
jgi:ABC-2 type transport system permease protein